MAGVVQRISAVSSIFTGSLSRSAAAAAVTSRVNNPRTYYTYTPEPSQPLPRDPKWVSEICEAVQCIKSGDTVFVQGAAATPIDLVQAMTAHGKSACLKDVVVCHMHTEGPAPYTDPECQGKLVMKKWATLRDNWMKCLKKVKEDQKSGSGGKMSSFTSQMCSIVLRSDVFHEELQFLTKIATHRQTTSNMPDNVNRDDRITERSDSILTHEPKKKHRMKATTELDQKIMNISEASLKREKSRSMSFLKGIAPTVDKFND